MDKVIVIVGPTAIGKSSLSIEIAKRFNGEIINGDSIQVYKELNIGSAKIKPEEQQSIQHYLLDYLNIDEKYNVARFQKDARRAIDEIIRKGKNPIVVGGTGLYIKALIYDYCFAEQKEIDENKYDEVKKAVSVAAVSAAGGIGGATLATILTGLISPLGIVFPLASGIAGAGAAKWLSKLLKK